jgi:predicted lipoprotein with Yx(FWY)xxD motif
MNALRSRCGPPLTIRISQGTKETNNMHKSQNSQPTTRRFAARSTAAGVTALFGLAVSVAAPGLAGASVNHASKGVVISTMKSSKFGTLLASGKTLYTLKASKTPCSTSCLKIWPELVLPKGVTKAAAGTGVSASKLGTISRPGGVLQVTYAGKPLYFFVGDKSSEAVNGNLSDTWGSWSDVVTVKPTTSGQATTTTSPGTGGVAF